MAQDDKAPVPPSKRRQEEVGSGEGTKVSNAPTDKPVDLDEPYVGVDDIYRNHAEDTHKPLLGDDDEVMEASITAEKERREAAEKAALGETDEDDDSGDDSGEKK